MQNESLSFDFLTHLQQRFGISRQRAREMLGAWLLSYEPEHTRRNDPETRYPRPVQGAEELARLAKPSPNRATVGAGQLAPEL